MSTATSTILLTAIRDDLLALGMARKPSVGGPLPPVFVEPENGTPAPGEREDTEAGDDLVIGLALSSEVAGAVRTRRLVVAFTYRTRGTAALKRARELDELVAHHYVYGSSYGVGIVAGAGSVPIQVLQASTFAGLSPVEDVAGVRTDRAAYVFEVLAA